MYMLEGGFHFDGREIRPVDKEEILSTITELKEKNISNVVVSGVFSPVCSDHEVQVGCNKLYAKTVKQICTNLMTFKVIAGPVYRLKSYNCLIYRK